MLHRIIGEHLELKFDFTGDQLMVNADPVMIDQILLNLAINARDAMPSGGLLNIRVDRVSRIGTNLQEQTSGKSQEFACLTVSDQGCGMNSDTMARIFEPFFTTKEVGKGTGLGLATVYGIVQQHQGWIEVESQLNKGSTFRVFLPLVKAPMKPAQAGTRQVPATRGNESILIAEDEPSVLAMLKSVLAGAGYQVYGCASGVAALEMWPRHGHEIDLVLTDMVMPGGVDGAALANRLVQEKPGLKIIFMSGYTSTPNHELSIEGAGIDFIAKPFNLEQVLQTVRKLLDTPVPKHKGAGKQDADPAFKVTPLRLIV